MTDVQNEIFRSIIGNDVEMLRRITNADPAAIHVPSFIADQSWLSVAAREGHSAIVAELLRAGADPNQPGLDGANALDAAAASKKPDVVRLLLENGAVMDVSATTRNPLFALCATQGDESDDMVEVARILIGAGIDTTPRYDTETMKGIDAIAFAMMWGRPGIARLIAETQADGDPEAVASLLAGGLNAAYRNTIPVPPGEENFPAPS